MFKSSAGNIRWLISRFTAMSPREVIIRIYRKIRFFLWRINPPRYHVRLINFPAPLPPIPVNKSLISVSQMKDMVAEAEEYCKHKWLFFGLENIFEPEIDWQKDIKSNISSPRIFGFDINHRDENLVGNIKITWEKNRHHHLTQLAACFYITGNEKYAREVINQIKSWIAQNPYLFGINWSHPLEQAIRLISWIYCERFLRGSQFYKELFGPESNFWESFYKHQKIIYENHSIGSSANNHLIGEMAGLYISALAWPIYKESGKWRKFSKRILEKEIIKQTYKSGINKELAFSYQIFVTEFFLLCRIESENFNDNISGNFNSILRSMLTAIYEITKGGKSLPNYGDGDEGRAIQLGCQNMNRIEWLMEICNTMFNTDFLVSNNNLETILLNRTGDQGSKGNLKTFYTKAYRDAGLFIIRKTDKRIGETEILFDAGPLGMGSMAAHGHADALNFTLTVNGIKVFIDPGTYCYHTELSFREYFRGTSAHNTLVVNGIDQSDQRGPFLWSRKAQSKLHQWSPEKNLIEASHDGYGKIGVSHKRKLCFTDELIIEDNITGKGLVNLDFRFHLSPQFHADIINDSVSISNDYLLITLNNSLGTVPKILKGKGNGGWYSPRFNVKVPTVTLTYQNEVYLPISQIFTIKLNSKDNES